MLNRDFSSENVDNLCNFEFLEQIQTDDVREIQRIFNGFNNEAQIKFSKFIFTGEALKKLSESNIPKNVAEGIIELSIRKIQTLGDEQFLKSVTDTLEVAYFNEIALTVLLSDIEKDLTLPESLILRLMNILNTADVGSSNIARKVLVQVFTCRLYNAERESQLLSTLMKNASQATSEILCRYFELAVEVSVNGCDRLQKMETILKIGFNTYCSSDDILLQLNILEIASDLSVKEYGYAYLESQGIIQKLLSELSGMTDDPLKALSLPGLMRFFGTAAAYNINSLMTSHPEVIRFILTQLENEGNIETFAVAVDTLGLICSKSDGMKQLDYSLREVCCHSIKQIYLHLAYMPNNIKLRIFDCLVKIFSNDDQNNHISLICEKWFTQSGINFKDLLTHCKNPFEDMSIAAYNLVNSLLGHSFARKNLLTAGGFIEHLLNRDSTSNPQILRVKYEIIQKLSTSTEIFDSSTIAKFYNYLHNGIFYISGQSEVVVDS